MRSTTFRLAILFGLIPLAGSAQQVDFARDVQPIFERSCSRCHGAAQQSGQLRLDSKESVLSGGASHSVVQPGDVEHSVLYQRVARIGAEARMPLGSELPDAEIALLKRWIAQGASATLGFRRAGAPSTAGGPSPASP